MLKDKAECFSLVLQWLKEEKKKKGALQKLFCEVLERNH